MIQLDSIKIHIPLECASINLESWDKHTVTKASSNVVAIFPEKPQTTIQYRLTQGLPLGCKSFTYIESQGILIELSAKILGKDYLQGISMDTIERVFKNLNLESIELEKDSIRYTSVMRLDCTKTLEFEKDSIPSILQSLKLSHSNGKFMLTDIKSESVIFKHMGKSIRERVIFYDKKAELEKAYNKKISSLIKLPNDKDFLRVESNISTYRDIRNRFKITSSSHQSIPLLHVLQSKENPILYLYDKIMQVPENESFLFYKSEIDLYRDMTPSEFIDCIGIRTLLDTFRNLEEIRDYMLSQLKYSKSSVSKVIKKINNLKLKSVVPENKNQVVEFVKQVREKLIA